MSLFRPWMGRLLEWVPRITIEGKNPD